jgi:hypothetical protein
VSTGSKISFGLLGLIVGTILGGGIGLGGGLAWTEIMDTSSFEGYSGLVVVSWIIAGICLGAAGGAILGAVKG